MKNALCRAGAVLLLLTLLATALSSSALAATSYFQGFETDTAGWLDNGGGTAERAPSGTDGIQAASGNYFALAPEHTWSPGGIGSAFTKFGGYESTFPAGGYFTSIGIYLDVDGGWTDGTEFGWDVAVNDTNGDFTRDFIFNVGFYDSSDTTAAGTGNRFVIVASGNGGDSTDPGHSTSPKAVISTSGWYTFKHVFEDIGDDSILDTLMTISDSNGNLVPGASWTTTVDRLVINDTVGGHRYGWFEQQGFSVLAFDDATLGLNDSIAPTTVASAENEDGSPYTFGTGTTQNVSVSLEASDSGTGVAATYYSVDGGAQSEYSSGPIDVTDEGLHTITFWSVDLTGNEEAHQTVAVDIVRTNAGLIALTQQYEQNGRDAQLMTAALNWANFGARIHNATIQRIGTFVFLYHVYTARGTTLTYEQANNLISLARQING